MVIKKLQTRLHVEDQASTFVIFCFIKLILQRVESNQKLT